MNRKKEWSPIEIDKLVKLYPNSDTKELAKLFNTPVHIVYGKANKLGLKKTAEHLKESQARTNKNLIIHGQKHRFVKGQKPMNFGQKMSKEVYERVKIGMFKKGGLPHNVKFDGYTRVDVDGYTHIRIAQGKFIPLHRKIWMDHNGELPPNHIIIFKDGNKQNFDINNLVCISRQEHAIRNAPHKYPEELKKLIKLNNKLKKQINEKQN